MNIYDFINSRDIAKYLKEINYEFSTIERAYIIEMADYVTLDEKINARQELLQTTEDCTVGGASLHGFLAEQCICASNGNDTRHNAELFFSDIVLNISDLSKKGIF